MPEFTPIGRLVCNRHYHEEQPRQGNLSTSCGYVELVLGYNYEQGLKDLSGFERIWLIYEFHRNKTWKPLANPPRSDGKGRKGVFATRSPYRPNPIGISCAKLISVEKNRIYVADSDLLNETPILDIKPYIPEYDCFPQAKVGWLENVIEKTFDVIYLEVAKRKIDFLKKQGLDLEAVIETQLKNNPFDKTRNKCIKAENGYLLRFKSWRIFFENFDKTIEIIDISSGYKNFDLLMGNDKEIDLAIHKKFIENRW